MIKVVIIEDEIPAREKLKRFLNEVEETVSIVAEISTVQEAIECIETTESIDLILSDIELLDGTAFDIYKETTISCPIIFTTAYNQFWMDAFESNGIEYLLKPFSLERFQKAWDKFIRLRSSNAIDQNLLSSLNLLIENTTRKTTFKKRFSLNTARATYFIETNNILFFEADEGVVFAVDNTGKRHLMKENTIKEFEDQLDPLAFFRINRSELVNKRYIEHIERYSKNAIALKIIGYERYLITSQSCTASFREWIEK